jgi:hypothetical protein
MPEATLPRQLLLICFAYCTASVAQFAQAQAPSPPTDLVRIAIDESGTNQRALTKQEFAEFGSRAGLVGCTSAQGAQTARVAVGRILSAQIGRAREQFLSLNRLSGPKDLVPPTVLRPLGTAPTQASGEKGSLAGALITFRRLSADPTTAGAAPQVPTQDCIEASQKASLAPDSVLIPDRVLKTVPDRRYVQLELTKQEQELLRTVKATVEVQPVVTDAITVRLSARPPETEMGDLPDPVEFSDAKTALEKLKSRVRGTGEPRPLLLVLDDAWPSEEHFISSRDFFQRAVPVAWRGVPPLVRGNLLMAMPTSWASSKDIGPPNGYGCQALKGCLTHASQIAASIAPFEDAARQALAQSPVEVVFVPLNKAQGAPASALLRTLWNFNYFASPAGVLSGMPTALDEQSRQTYLNEGTRFEERFLEDQVAPGALSMRASGAVIFSVISFARFYSEQAKVPVYINISWTTDDKYFQFPEIRNEYSHRVLAVSAAGNDCKPSDGCAKFLDDVATVDIKPVARSGKGKEYLTVMNVSAGGAPTCWSNRIRPEWYAVAYSGRTETDCGTSFASPRVSWLLAARSAADSTSAPKAWWRGNDALVSQRSGKCAPDKNDFNCMRITAKRLFPVLSAP